MKICLFTLCLVVFATRFCDASSPPNIVVLLADDLGWNAVGYHNDEFETPHIDSIAAKGAELDQFYVAPMCSPTRAGFLTGRYPIRFGCARAVIPPYRDFGLPLSETTLAEMLEQVGYADRSVFGKWHLGHRRAKWHPLNQGFTHFHGHYNGAIDYFELTRDGERDWHVGYEPSQENGYATDLIADAAAEWISQAVAKESPYFCYVPFNAPHAPFQAPEDAMQKYAANADKAGQRQRETYKAMVGRMDEGIGKILNAIEASGESDNTIVWFFGDNGGVGELRDLNKPLRGAKLSVFEGGIRVPACVRWPARIAAGRTADVRCGYIDLLPTLVAAAGGDVSAMSNQPLDGISLLPELTGEGSLDLARPWFTYHGQSGPKSEELSVIDDGWKLIVLGPKLESVEQLGLGKHKVHLFHLTDDPLERTNLAEEQPRKVTAMGEMLAAHRNLQPKRSVPRYSVGKDGFIPQPNWKLNPKQPEQLLGRYEDE